MVTAALCCPVAGCLDFKNKTSKDGDLVQVFHYGGPGDDFATSVVALGDGGFVMTGIHGGGKVFDSTTFADFDSEDQDASFVARIDRNGSTVWVVNVAAAGDPGNTPKRRVQLFSAAVGEDDILFVGGHSAGELLTVASSASGEPEEIEMRYDLKGDGTFVWLGAVVLAFDLTTGDLLWHTAGGEYGYVYDIVTENDSVYLLGGTGGSLSYLWDVDVAADEHGDHFEFRSISDDCGPYGSHVFVAEHNLDGDLEWAVPLLGCARGYDLTLCDGKLVLTGSFKGKLELATNPLPPEPEPRSEPAEELEFLEIETPSDDYDAFVAFLDVADGKTLRARRVGGERVDFGTGLTCLSESNLVVAGAFVERADVCGDETCSPIVDHVETESEPQALFLVEYTAENAEFRWATHADVMLEPRTELFESFSMVPVDDGGLVLGGGFEGTATFDPGGANAVTLKGFGGPGMDEPFIAKYDAGGALRWARSECGQDADGSIHSLALLTLAGEQIILAAGGFTGTAVFGAGEANETTLVSEPGLPGDQDIFVLQLRDE